MPKREDERDETKRLLDVRDAATFVHVPHFVTKSPLTHSLTTTPTSHDDDHLEAVRILGEQ